MSTWLYLSGVCRRTACSELKSSVSIYGLRMKTTYWLAWRMLAYSIRLRDRCRFAIPIRVGRPRRANK